MSHCLKVTYACIEINQISAYLTFHLSKLYLTKDLQPPAYPWVKVLNCKQSIRFSIIKGWETTK